MKTTAVAPILLALCGLLHSATLAAQATNPPYLREMPPVERVLREVKGADADETAARQMGAFLQFKSIIEKMASYRFYRNQLTADEKRVIQVYYSAYWDIAKTKPEYQKFTGLKGFDIDPDYRQELFNRFLSPSFRTQYEAIDAEFKRNSAARAKADTQNMLRARQDAADAQKQLEAQMGGGAEQRQLRRCIESGRSESQCLSEGLGKSFKNMMGGAGLFPMLNKGPASGLRMGGAYPAPSTGNVGLTFYAEHTLTACQDLVPDPTSYTVALKDGQALITIETNPKPLVFVVRPDGRLAGPGPVDIAGRIVTGVSYGTRTWSDGRTEPISRPIYGPATRRCNAGVLTTSGPAPPGGSMGAVGAVALDLIAGSPDPMAGKTAPPGLGLTGEYGGQAGFDLDFRPDGVLVGCRDATVFRAYTVRVQGNQVLVNVQHGATPLTLSMGSDGRLTGSGSVRVDGRAVSGTAANGDIAFTPRSATCALGILPPAQAAAAAGGAPTTSGAAAPTTPAAGDAVLAVAATTGAAVPVAGRSVLLLNDELVSVLTQGGFQPAGGKSLLRSLGACQASDANCQKGMSALLGHVVVAAKTDAGGKAGFAAVAPGTYYVVLMAGSDSQPALWNLKVQLKAGDNAIVLDQRNATSIP